MSGEVPGTFCRALNFCNGGAELQSGLLVPGIRGNGSSAVQPGYADVHLAFFGSIRYLYFESG